jgi:WD40 repeat protein
MVDYPVMDAVSQAFLTLYGPYDNNHKNYETFASRWGGLNLEAFQRALAEGEGEDRLPALMAIGFTATTEAADIIAPYTQSPFRLERWGCALCLGRMRDERAFPALQALLTDGLSLNERQQALQDPESDLAHELSWCARYRPYIVPLLAPWNTPALVAQLQEAFSLLWRVEQRLGLDVNEVNSAHALAYALGQRAKFDAFARLDLPSLLLKVETVYLVLGYLQDPPRSENYNAWRTYLSPTLKTRVEQVLAQHLGLSPAQQQDYTESFQSHVLERNDQARYPYQQRLQDAMTALEEDEAPFEEEDAETSDEEEPEHANVSILGGDIDKKRIATSPLSIFQEHEREVVSLAWSPDSTLIASASHDSTVRVWKAETGKILTTFRGHTAPVGVVAWSPEGTLIASGGCDNRVYVWEARTGKPVTRYEKHTGWIYQGLVWSPDGQQLASASWDQTVQVWDARTGETTLVFRGHQAVVCSLAWSPDGNFIASGSGHPECLVYVWHAQTGALHTTYHRHQEDRNQERDVPASFDEDTASAARSASDVRCLAWSPDGIKIASSGIVFSCNIWNPLTGRHLVQLPYGCTSGPVAWSPNGAYIATPRPLEGVDLWEGETGKIVVNYQPEKLRYEAASLAWSPDGRYLVASDDRAFGIGEKLPVVVWSVGEIVPK